MTYYTTCDWAEEEDGTHSTECGDCWDATVGSPKLYAIVFCPFCGRKIEATTYRPKDVEP